MTGTDVMEACWEILQDLEEPRQFYPAQQMVKWVNEGVEQITQRRPDSLVDEAGASIRTITPLTDLDDTIGISNRWKSPLIEWVLSRAFQSDGEDRGDQTQAGLHRQLFDDYVGR